MKHTLLTVAVIASLLGGVVGGSIAALVLPSLPGRIVSPGSTEVPAPNAALAEQAQTTAVVERTAPAIVSIAITKDLSKLPQRRFIDPFSGDILNEEVPEGIQRIGGGSGFLVSADGLIVTNRHVVEDPEAEYTVILRNGDQLPAKVLARDPVLDLAIIDVEGGNHPFLTFGDSDAVQPGQTVIAIGNALDEFRNTVTKGIVSGLNRRLTASDFNEPVLIEEAIQTDAAINRGNSGGPLIDLEGRVIGVSTAVSFAGQLIGFALPGNAVQRDVEQVQRHGRITRPLLGVRYVVITEEVKKENNLDVDHGVLVLRGVQPGEPAVIPGSPAEKAGIRENDVILSIDGMEIDEEHSLSSLIGRHVPGDEVKVRILREGKEQELTIKLDEFTPPAE